MELTFDDKRILHQFKINAHIIFWTCISFAVLANYLVIEILKIGAFNNLIILNSFLFGFSAFISHMYYLPFKKDLKKGQKKVILEKVMDKRFGRDCMESQHLKKRKRFFLCTLISSKKTKYCILVSNRKYLVSKKLYEALEIGDSIEMHYTIMSKTLIRLKKLNEEQSN